MERSDSWPQNWASCHFIQQKADNKKCDHLKQYCTCLYFTSNGKAAIAQECVVFQRGNPKKPSAYCRNGGSGSGAFISLTFSILRALCYLLCSHCRSPFMHSSATNSYLEIHNNTEKPCVWFEGDASLSIQINASPGFLRLNYWRSRLSP